VVSPSERFAIAAHLHVLLRRKTGRVTDTEWMAVNAEYAAEIARFCRINAADGTAPELASWADKLEACHAPGPGRAATGASPPASLAPTAASELSPTAPPQSRYIGGLR